MKPLRLLSLGLLLLIGAAGCSKPPAPAQPLAEPTYFEADNPKSLREWGMVQTSDGALILGARVTPYDLTTPLFTDYAQKLRTIWMPPGVSADYTPDDALSFPVGTVITKTFFYPTGAKGRVLQQADPSQFHAGDGLKLKQVRMIETRLLIRRPEGWTALTYLWNEAQTDAVLHRVGAAVPLTMTGSDGKDETFSYIVPNATQCSACHATNVATREIQPIGPKARLLNRDFAYSDRTENEPPDRHGLSEGRRRSGPGAASGVVDRRRRIDRGPRQGLSRRQLRPLPQPQGSRRHLGALSGCALAAVRVRRPVQTARRGGRGHGEPAVRHRAGQGG